MKPLAWVGSALDDVRDFPRDARARAGHELDAVQRGRDPTDWKPMPTVGAGVREIRVHAGNEYRVLYVASFPEAVYVLHAFVKKSRSTPMRELVVAMSRLHDVIRIRAAGDTT